MTMYPTAPGTPANLRKLKDVVYPLPQGEMNSVMLEDAARRIELLEAIVKRIRRYVPDDDLEAGDMLDSMANRQGKA